MGRLPSGKHTEKAIETGTVEIVDLPINSMVIVMLVYQRVIMMNGINPISGDHGLINTGDNGFIPLITHEWLLGIGHVDINPTTLDEVQHFTNLKPVAKHMLSNSHHFIGRSHPEFRSAPNTPGIKRYILGKSRGNMTSLASLWPSN